MTGHGRRVQRRQAVGAVAIGCIAAASLALSTSALATFPGANGQIAVHHAPAQPGATAGIYAIDPATRAMTQLTGTPARDTEPSYSADGERILFTRRESGGRARVWIMNADGSGQVQLATPSDPGNTDDHSAGFSPDGKRVVFVRDGLGEPQLWIMNADGSGQTQLTFDGANDESFRVPYFSPDGQRIVTEYDDDLSGSQIAVINADGSNFEPLTDGGPSESDPDWSPDGRRITFERDYEIWVMNADGSGQAPITDVGTSYAYTPRFSPDGARVVLGYYGSPGDFDDVRLADPNSFNQVTSLTQNEGTDASTYSPGWQPLDPPACELAGRSAQKSMKSIRLRVTCTNENAALVAKGSGKAAKVKSTGSSKKRRFRTPPVKAQVPAATPTTVKLAIPKQGSKALKRAMKAGKKSKAKITATLTDDLGLASRETFKVRFKKKKKKT